MVALLRPSALCLGMSLEARPFTIHDHYVLLSVRLTPRASRNGLDGVVEAGDRMAAQIRLSAPPVEGAANKALIAFMAGELGLRKSDVDIRSGRKSRIKTLELSGDPDDLVERIEKWLDLARGFQG